MQPARSGGYGRVCHTIQRRFDFTRGGKNRVLA